MIQGKTIISEEVFTELVRIAVGKVEHVSLTLNEGGSFFSLAKRMTDKITSQIAVKKTDASVEESGMVKKGHVSCEVKVSVEYGANIPEVVEALREAVVRETVAITDYAVDAVDVVVVRLVQPQPEPEAVEAEEVPAEGEEAAAETVEETAEEQPAAETAEE